LTFAVLLMQQLLAWVIRFQETDGAAPHAGSAPIQDRYIADVVFAMALVGIGILLVRAVKLYKNRSRYPLRKAEIQEIRRRFRGAA
jgi:hypothetical protein